MQARKASVQNEVVVVFLDKHVRDVVAAHGKNLSAYTDEKGWPTAGMRLEYPSHLGRSFLDWYGREMKMRHGPGTRRNVKFNDDDRSLYIDICLPKEEHWHRIPHAEAKRYREKVTTEKARRSRLSLEGPPRWSGGDGDNSNKIPLGASTKSHSGPTGWGGDHFDERPAYVSPRRRE